jgi:hypothetical protein
MSSPVQEDRDKKVNDTQPWVNDPRRQEEARRLEEEVIRAAQHLERESGRLSSQAVTQRSRPRTEVGFRLAEVRPIKEKSSPQERAEKFWASFNPELMPRPPQGTMRLPGLRLIAGLSGAVGIAAAVAFAVSNVVQIPTTSAAVSGKAEVESNEPVSTAILQRLTRIEVAQANVQRAEPLPAPTERLAATQTNIVAVAPPSAAAPPASPEVETSQPDARTPSTVAAAEPHAAVSLAPDKVASLLKRAQDLIAAGDVASGRVMLAYLAEAGDAQASFILAGTFDAAVLAKFGVVGVQPDPDKARAWYARAAEQGSSEAMQRLRQSALR